MVRKFFAYDGKVMEILNKTGEIILLNIMVLVFSLPVITITPALTSFYYAMIKSVRRERGNPVKEFMRSMKRTIGRGILLTLGIFLWMGALLYGRWALHAGLGGTVNFRRVLYDVLLVLSACVLIYIFPVFSRFEMKLSGIVKLSFVMSIRYLPVTAAVTAGSAVIGWLLIYYLPIACILVVPGVWCYLVTFLMEKALLHYMPAAKAGEEQWYDADGRTQAEDERKTTSM